MTSYRIMRCNIYARPCSSLMRLTETDTAKERLIRKSSPAGDLLATKLSEINRPSTP